MNIERAKQLQIQGPKGALLYGGDQRWYSSNTRAQGGCGSVAAANALRALALNDKGTADLIRTGERIPDQLKEALLKVRPAKDCFEILMTGIYNKMHAFEIPILNRIYDRKSRDHRLFKIIRPNQGQTNTGFIIGIIRFAKSLGINIKVNYLTTAFADPKEGRSFIEEGLEKSGAVVLMTSYNKHGLKLYPEGAKLDEELKKGAESSMKCHFATITDMDGDRVLISTWGKPAVGSFMEISSSWQSIKAFESTLMYITPSDKKEAKTCMFNAYKAFAGGVLKALTRGKIK